MANTYLKIEPITIVANPMEWIYRSKFILYQYSTCFKFMFGSLHLYKPMTWKVYCTWRYFSEINKYEIKKQRSFVAHLVSNQHELII